MNVKFILPAVSDDAVSEWLRALTERICAVTGEQSGFGLGGEHGYGENYENGVFMMHRYCWCGQADCSWCCECTCGDDYKANPCQTCKGERTAAPNFMHKATGASVRWYKYIGRGMTVDEAHWPEIFADCFASLPPHKEGGDE